MLEKLYEGMRSLTEAVNADWVVLGAAGVIVVLFVCYFIASVCGKNYGYRKTLEEISAILNANDPLDRACMKQVDALFEKLPAPLYCTWNRMLLQKNVRAAEAMTFERSFDVRPTIFRRVCSAVGALLSLAVLVVALCGRSMPQAGAAVQAEVLVAPLLIAILATLSHFFMELVDKLHGGALKTAFYEMTSLIEYKVTKSAILTLQEEPRTEIAAVPTVAKGSEKQPGTIDMILSKIDEVKAAGADSQSVEQIILMLQQEKEKQSNNTPEAQRAINDALADLLRSISDEE